MRKIIIGQNLNSGMAVLGFLLGFAALLLVLTGPAHARQHVEFGGSCNGTSECVGNLSCHVGSLQWNLEPEKTCECPEPGDGSYSEGTNPENNDRGIRPVRQPDYRPPRERAVPPACVIRPQLARHRHRQPPRPHLGCLVRFPWRRDVVQYRA